MGVFDVLVVLGSAGRLILRSSEGWISNDPLQGFRANKSVGHRGCENITGMYSTKVQIWFISERSLRTYGSSEQDLSFVLNLSVATRFRRRDEYMVVDISTNEKEGAESDQSSDSVVVIFRHHSGS